MRVLSASKHVVRLDLCGADRLRYSVSKLLCEVEDGSTLRQWTESLNAAAATAQATSGPAAMNAGMDEEEALRAAIALSSREAEAAFPPAGDDDESEDDAPLRRRRDAPTDMFGTTPFAVTMGQPAPEPQPEPQPALDAFADLFGEPTAQQPEPAGSRPAQNGATLDIFGSVPFSGGADDDGAGTRSGAGPGSGTAQDSGAAAAPGEDLLQW